MTPETERLVKQSWSMVSQRGPALAERFYQRLFEIAPDQRQLFGATNMVDQRRKFIAMLQEIVVRIDTPSELVPEVASLGSRHAKYGVTDRGYGVVGEALVWSLEQEMGSAMTAEVRDAWREAYLLLAGLMMRGALRIRPDVTPVTNALKPDR